MSRRVTRSQQRKQEEQERGSSTRGSVSGEGSMNGSVNEEGDQSPNGTPRKGRSPTKRQRLTAVAVVVQNDKKEEPEMEETVIVAASGAESIQVRTNGVAKEAGEDNAEGKKNGEKTINKSAKSSRKTFDDEEEHSTKLFVKAVVVEKPLKQVNEGDAVKVNGIVNIREEVVDSEEEDDDDDDDAAPEAVSLSTGRQAILAQEEEIKRVREQQEASLRLKRKTHDARLKEQKGASQAQAQPPAPKRQKLAPSPLPASTDAPSAITIPSSIPSSTQQPTTSPSAEPPSPTGLLSPTSSTTLSLQGPPTDPSHPFNLMRLRNKYSKPKVPLLLPESLLEEVARLPSPPPPGTTVTKPHQPQNIRKTLADFEAEEKAALEALEKKKAKAAAGKLPTYKRGPVTVAVLGSEEQRERNRRIMAPPGSRKVSAVRDVWVMGRKLSGGERRAVLPVGGKAFVRRK